jgi:hypothetical protein
MTELRARAAVSILHVELTVSNSLTLVAAWFVLFAPKEAVEKTLKETIPDLLLRQRLKLLDTPTGMNVPAGLHPVIISAGSIDDVRQGNFQLATKMMTASSMIPYVGIDQSETPYIAPIISYIAGVDATTQGYVSGLIPSIVGKQLPRYRPPINLTCHCEAYLGGQATRIGLFRPLDAPFQEYNDGSKGINVNWAQAPNPATGPGLYSAAFDLKFVDEPDQTSPKYSIGDWKKWLNQPYLQGSIGNLGTPLCVRSTTFLTNSTAQPTFRTGNVTLGPSAGLNPLTAHLQNASPDGLGFYQNVYGFSACGQVVGYGFVIPTGERCGDAAEKVKNTPGAL